MILKFSLPNWYLVLFFCFVSDLLVFSTFRWFVCRFCEIIKQKFKFVTIIVFAASAQLWLHTIKKKPTKLAESFIESKWYLLFDWCMLMCIEIRTHVLRTQIDSVIITTNNRKNVTLAHSHSRLIPCLSDQNSTNNLIADLFCCQCLFVILLALSLKQLFSFIRSLVGWLHVISHYG